MKQQSTRQPVEKPASISQLVAALATLGQYSGTNSEAEHVQEAARVGGKRYYRMLLANALLGHTEIEAMLADGTDVSTDQLLDAKHQALRAAGVAETPAKLLACLRWRTLQVAGPLREMVQDETTGPVVLAAAHAAEGLQQLLGVCEAGQNPEDASPELLTADLRLAREALTNAVTNIDIMLRLVQQAKNPFSE